MTNKVRYGLTNVHVAVIEDVKDDKEVYGEFQRVRGAVNLSLDPQGDQTPFYADNMAYHVFTSNAGYEGSIELAELPEFFLEEILGEKKVNGVLVEDINAKGKSFALAFEFDGDKKATRHVLYNCTASRPTISGQTNAESIEAQTSELTFTAAPSAKGVVRAKTASETADEVYNTWFTAPFDAEATTTEED
ncbi:phage tail protein [Savagea sp. SN6]|uniref:Phage tail protein n=1 Tax=Savagea serpentis TaxID=2785297 RepID=A0A8J7G9A6_9BACL|nr:major tail protein [Savagea serpentis]MBF4500235.1 phage tail protein [Savagea serpentis]